MDAVRSEYRDLSKKQKVDIAEIKRMANMLINYMADEAFLLGTREGSLAKTKMEEAVMWAVKGITE